MAREYLRFAPEETWGVLDPTSPAWVNVQLTDKNQFTMRKKPEKWLLRSAGGFNRRVQTGSSKTTYAGNLSNLVLYGSQAAAFVAWLLPTGSPLVLPSCTIDHAIVMEDGSNTTVYKRYLGAFITQAEFTADSSTQLMRLGLQLTAKTTATITVTDFAEPAATDYPSDAPYVIEHASALTLGSSRAEFDAFKVTIKNMVDSTHFNSATITRKKVTGRDVDWQVHFPYIVTTDRSNFDSVTGATGGVVFTNGAHVLTFDFNDQNFYEQVQDQLDYGKLFMQELNMQTYFDSSVPGDFGLTAT